MEGGACLAQLYKNSLRLVGCWIWRGIIVFVSSCFSLISFGRVFPGSAIVHRLSFGYDTGFGERGGRMGACVGGGKSGDVE